MRQRDETRAVCDGWTTFSLQLLRNDCHPSEADTQTLAMAGGGAADACIVRRLAGPPG